MRGLLVAFEGPDRSGETTQRTLFKRLHRVDAEQSIGQQHRQIRELFFEGQRRPWSEWNVDAVAEWLALNTRHR